MAAGPEVTRVAGLPAAPNLPSAALARLPETAGQADPFWRLAAPTTTPRGGPAHLPTTGTPLPAPSAALASWPPDSGATTSNDKPGSGGAKAGGGQLLEVLPGPAGG